RSPPAARRARCLSSPPPGGTGGRNRGGGAPPRPLPPPRPSPRSRRSPRARSRRSIRTPVPPVRGWAPGPIRGPTTPSTGGRRPRTRKGRTMVLDIISAVLFFLGALLSLAAAVGLARFGDLL